MNDHPPRTERIVPLGQFVRHSRRSIIHPQEEKEGGLTVPKLKRARHHHELGLCSILYTFMLGIRHTQGLAFVQVDRFKPRHLCLSAPGWHI